MVHPPCNHEELQVAKTKHHEITDVIVEVSTHTARVFVETAENVVES